MKKKFAVQKERPQVELVLTRDSVCAADDGDAPHETKVKMRSFLDAEALARETSSGYLPNVAGVGHSWTCLLNDKEIAEIKTTGIKPLVREIRYEERNRIHFAYTAANY